MVIILQEFEQWYYQQNNLPAFIFKNGRSYNKQAIWLRRFAEYQLR